MFELINRDGFQVLKILEREIWEPHHLHNLKIPAVDNTNGVIISGRAPIWLYCYLTHLLHTTAWVAIYDPRLAAAVVVENHIPGGWYTGEVITGLGNFNL